jgi:endonuclease/exonuclease/phosphatase family metal-dependent hydrolase
MPRPRNALVLFLCLVLTILVGCGSETSDREEDAAAGPISFTVVALNAEWLFDGIGEEEFSTAPQSPEEAEAHLADVASYLASVDPDFISLAEIEDRTMLDRLNEKLGGGYRPIFVQGTDDQTGQDVAALSRYPVIETGRSDARVRYPVPESSLRGPMGTEAVYKHYWATTEVGGRTIALIGLHLLAYPDELLRVVRREAQASIIRDLAKGFLDAGQEVIVLGDVNDFDADVCDAAGNEPRTCVDRLLKDVDPDRDGDELVNVCDRLEQCERYTYWYDRNRNGIDDGDEEHSQIDHIYVSHGLIPYLTDVRIDHSYEAGTVSDHWPVLATFEFPED